MLKYNKDKIITYHLIHNNESNDNDLDDEIDVEVIYRNEFLSLFYLEDYDADIISKQMDILYDLLISNERLTALCKNIAMKNFMSEDMSIGFITLFSFTYLYLFHDYIKIVINSGNGINDDGNKILQMIEDKI